MAIFVERPRKWRSVSRTGALITGGRRGFQEFVPLAQKIAASGIRVLLHDRRNTGASANPANRERLMRMDPQRYTAVMSRWLEIFTRGPVSPMYGVSEEALRSIAVPTVVVPGNDKTHSMAGGAPDPVPGMAAA
jgi:hypothetical protein